MAPLSENAVKFMISLGNNTNSSIETVSDNIPVTGDTHALGKILALVFGILAGIVILGIIGYFIHQDMKEKAYQANRRREEHGWKMHFQRIVEEEREARRKQEKREQERREQERREQERRRTGNQSSGQPGRRSRRQREDEDAIPWAVDTLTEEEIEEVKVEELPAYERRDIRSGEIGCRGGDEDEAPPYS